MDGKTVVDMLRLMSLICWNSPLQFFFSFLICTVSTPLFSPPFLLFLYLPLVMRAQEETLEEQQACNHIGHTRLWATVLEQQELIMTYGAAASAVCFLYPATVYHPSQMSSASLLITYRGNVSLRKAVRAKKTKKNSIQQQKAESLIIHFMQVEIQMNEGK